MKFLRQAYSGGLCLFLLMTFPVGLNAFTQLEIDFYPGTQPRMWGGSEPDTESIPHNNDSSGT